MLTGHLFRAHPGNGGIGRGLSAKVATIVQSWTYSPPDSLVAWSSRKTGEGCQLALYPLLFLSVPSREQPGMSNCA